ncbi:NAD-dependent deacetylase, partial [Xanthomonas oryzae pv. oryzae]
MTAVPAHDDHALQDFIERHQRLFVLTGAGCSTDSGIPDYRDLQGGWK